MTIKAENFDTNWFANELSSKLIKRDKSILTHIAVVSDKIGIIDTKAQFTCYHLRKNSKNSLRTSTLIELMSDSKWHLRVNH